MLNSLEMEFVLIINLKLLLKIANSFFLNIVEHENFSANMKMPTNVGIFISLQRTFHAHLS